MFWLALYVAAMFCIALPLAWFGKNEVAGIVFAVWGIGQVAYQIGLPEPATQVVIYGAAFGWLSFRIAPRDHDSLACIGAATIFLPLLLVCALWGWGGTSDHDAWWGVYWLAMAQVALLTRPIAWFIGARRWIAERRSAPNTFMMVAA